MRKIVTILFLTVKILASGIDPATFMKPIEYNIIECVPTKESIIHQIDSMISVTDISIVDCKVLYYDVDVTLFLDKDSITNPQKARLSTKDKFVITVFGVETPSNGNYILHYNSRKYMFKTYVVDCFIKTNKLKKICFPSMKLFATHPIWELTYVDGGLFSAFYEYGCDYIYVDLLKDSTVND